MYLGHVGRAPSVFKTLFLKLCFYLVSFWKYDSEQFESSIKSHVFIGLYHD